MTEREIDDALAALRSTLTVEPSPAFAAGVRARIDRDRGRGWVAWLVVSAAVAGVVLGVLLLSRSMSGGGMVTESADARSPVAHKALPAMAAPTQTAAPRIASAAARVVDPAANRQVRPAASERVLEVLVPADQRLALSKLLADLNAGRVEGAALVAAPLEPAAADPMPADLVIAPIEIPAIGGGGGVIK